MPIPPMPMQPGVAAPGATPGTGVGPGLPKSPIGGPSGPGASPMVSPGTGAGMQAAASKGTMAVIDTLMGYAKAYNPGTPEFEKYMQAIRILNSIAKKSGNPATPPAPIPVPATPPGGAGATPNPSPAGGAMMSPGGME